MSVAKTRAEEISAREDVQRWIKRFNRLSKDMPKDIWVYVAAGTPTVMASDANGRMFERSDVGGGGSDPEAVIATIDRAGGKWDGGDW